MGRDRWVWGYPLLCSFSMRGVDAQSRHWVGIGTCCGVRGMGADACSLRQKERRARWLDGNGKTAGGGRKKACSFGVVAVRDLARGCRVGAFGDLPTWAQLTPADATTNPTRSST